MQNEFDNNLQSYFTDMEDLRVMFEGFVSEVKLPKHLIVFHGVGGVGKSSLLRMFRLHCKNEKIPVALASGDDAKSVLDFVTRWTEDLKGDGIKFVTLSKTLASYRAIQAKVEDQAKKSQNKVVDIASQAASKTATVGGALVGGMIGSAVPVIGTALGSAVGGAVSGMGAEALTDWLRGFLSKPDIDLLLDPAKKLSGDFLKDMTKAAEKKRMVLLLDTFEQMSALEDWVGEIAQKIDPNVLVVIAGRKIPDWNRVWSAWMMNAQVEELKPMTEDIMRQLIDRYFATMRRGEPNPAQVDAIIKFARGLPIVVTSAVQLWVKYGVEDFQLVKAEIIANLVDRLMEGVPSALIPALEAAAVVRWFDQPILRAVMNKEDVREVYNELRRFPFVRTRVEGLALHDSVREMMDENLRVQDSERHAELHERAAVYFEKKLEKVTGEEAERLGLERLYHRIRAEEELGIKLFQEMAEELTQYQLENNLRTLLNDFNLYPLENIESNLWREFYNSWLLSRLGNRTNAEATYLSIIKDANSGDTLRSYAMCELGHIWTRRERLGLPNGVRKASEILDKSKRFLPSNDRRLLSILSAQRKIWALNGDFEKGLGVLHDHLQSQEANDNPHGAILILSLMKDLCGLMGDWKGAETALVKGLNLLKSYPSPYLKSRMISDDLWHQIWSGNLFKTQQGIEEGITFKKENDFSSSKVLLRTLGLVLGLQGKYEDSEICFREVVDRYERKNSEWQGGKWITLSFWGLILVRQSQFEKAKEYLSKCLEFKQKIGDNSGIPEVACWLGILNETMSHVKSDVTVDKLSLAESSYNECLSLKLTNRHYFECGALTGLVRVKHIQGNLATIPPLLAEAEQLAQKYEYNDHLASLRLTQGHLTFESGGDLASPTQRSRETKKGEMISILHWYKQAMIYALRYNRFLLDELLSGRSQGTPLRPIIPHCLECGEEGKKVLSALRDWWKTGINDVGTPRPDTISPIPEGILLLEAEKIARERELGDGSVQRRVVEQIEAVL
jgi:tetratricopeptide (TPR) repeat protein